MSFAYLIVAYRSESDLPACLDALDADRPDDATITVVHSKPGSTEAGGLTA